MVVTKINLFGDLPAISVVWSVISTLSAAIEKDSSLFSLFSEAVHESRKRLTATRNPRGVWGLGGVWSWWILDWTTAPHPPPLPSKVNASSTTESSRRLIPPPTYWCRGPMQRRFYGSGRQKSLNNYGRPASSNVVPDMLKHCTAFSSLPAHITMWPTRRELRIDHA